MTSPRARRRRTPTRADSRSGSFSINLNSGRWADFATGDSGANLLQLYAYLRGVGIYDAAADLASHFGLDSSAADSLANRPSRAVAPAPVGPSFVCPIPKRSPKPPLQHAKAVYTYRDRAGWPLFHACLFTSPSPDDPSVVEKAMVPATLWRYRSGLLRWQYRFPPGPRPLYGLHVLFDRLADPVMVYEGEKCADVGARALPSYVAIASLGGAESASYSDWGVLSGRDVVIWPDADAPGERYALSVASLCREVGARSVAILDLVVLGDALGLALSNGDDVADVCDRGVVGDRILSAVVAASKPFSTPVQAAGA